MMNINVFQVKGGQGCTTVAVAIALLQSKTKRVLLTGDLPELCAVMGLSAPYGDTVYVNDQLTLSDESALTDEHDVVVWDMGTIKDQFVGGCRVMVTTSCYLALRAGVCSEVSQNLDYLVHRTELHRAITTGDVNRALGAEAIAIDTDPRVARCIDAGLLMARMPDSLYPLGEINAPASVA